jgi:nicotinamide riboside transporter PnuC
MRPARPCVLVGHLTLAPDADSAHTATMTLKNAALLALIGTLLLAILLAADFIKTVSGVLNDVIPAMALLRSLIYLLGILSVTVFFYVFNKAQSR